MNSTEQLYIQDPHPHNPIVITAILSLSTVPSHQWLHQTILTRFLKHPRFRSRVVFRPWHAPHFELVPNFTPGSTAVAEHIITEPPIDPSLPFEQRHNAFTSRLSDIVAETLPPNRPLWRFFIFPNFSVTRPKPTDNPDCATLILRVHHSITDGIGLLKYVFAKVVDPEAPLPISEVLPVPHRQRIPSRKKGYSDVQTSPKSVISFEPRQRTLYKRSHDFFQAMSRTLIGSFIPEPVSMLTRSTIQAEKVCAVIPPSTLSFSTLRSTTHTLGVTMNDLLLASLSGALAKHMLAHGDDPSRLDLRVVLPFSKHMFEAYSPTDVRNDLALLAVPLHVNAPDARTRLARCAQTMRDAKNGIQPTLAYSAVQLVALLPRMIVRKLWRHLSRHASIMFTNVPGPRNRVAIEGVEFEAIHFFGPPGEDQGTTVSAFSYDGSICIGMHADKLRMPDAQDFVTLLHKEIELYVQVSKEA